ncbi:hypothetical protein E3N88_44351 [Mikania micrantha]|uniref:DUF679 domain-containing protein n=1 Tax=Mikania micrantha TaxID=192012 RepID=A0A5N6LCJ2_9ASTR|nr:hypothetical protein E3N88_44350 [Mikania micrantha]KAD0377773.1 hypothetical protein E3N88_44351 [Mikania micrantha]
MDDENQADQSPLLETTTSLVQRNVIQNVISQTFQSTANLANLLPTGTVLAFHLLSPIFTNQGVCDPMSRALTTVLVGLCGLSCFLLSFTDSFVDGDGNICYGFATINGLYVMDGNISLTPEIAAKYKLKFSDFMHAFMSIMVFAAVALFDQNVVNCFYPSPSDDIKNLLTTLPIGLGVFFSMLFVAFPSQRHGIGFPAKRSLLNRHLKCLNQIVDKGMIMAEEVDVVSIVNEEDG